MPWRLAGVAPPDDVISFGDGVAGSWLIGEVRHVLAGRGGGCLWRSREEVDGDRSSLISADLGEWRSWEAENEWERSRLTWALGME